MSVVNWGVTPNKTPKNTRTLWEKLRGNSPPLPQGTLQMMKKNGKTMTKNERRNWLNKRKSKTEKSIGGRLTNYNKRALGFLSERSHNVAMMNVKKVTSNNTRKTLQRALNRTRRNK